MTVPDGISGVACSYSLWSAQVVNDTLQEQRERSDSIMNITFRSAKYEHLDADGVTKITYSELSCGLPSEIIASGMKLVFRTVAFSVRLILALASLLYVGINKNFVLGYGRQKEYGAD